ncbi:MAG: hypothetical protein HeimC2_15430 [Candidatus Heimdallarchaeota archaeon LC_2]|nr:MAG: hypothetical protein HeimC2_15430 [Candidatus Heimdallarchaeota archaeon LC_2]
MWVISGLIQFFPISNNMRQLMYVSQVIFHVLAESQLYLAYILYLANFLRENYSYYL